MISLVRSVRPLAVLAAALLVAGVAPATPAAAETPQAAISISAKVVYLPTNAELGPPGTSEDAPADAGAQPGSVSVRMVVTNTGTDPLHLVDVAAPEVTNGHLDAFECQELNDRPDLTLYLGWWTECTATISGIAHGTLNEDAFSVSAVGTQTGAHVSATSSVWAAASPAGTPRRTVSIGDLVYLDSNRNHRRDAGEPGIPGVTMSLSLDSFQPTPDSGYISLETTTDEHGAYRFAGLERGYTYELTISGPQSPALADLAAWTFPLGAEPLNGSVTYRTTTLLESDDAIDFGFVPRTHPTITNAAPRQAVAGTTIEVTGHPSVPTRPYLSDDPMVLEFRAGGTSTWTKVAETRTRWDTGDAVVATKVRRSGWFRWRFPGEGLYIAPGVSPEVHVLVTRAPVALTATAPATVGGGTPLTVTGTITRSGTPFATGRIVLERSTDATTWATVADVRSSNGALKATVDPARTGSYRFRYAGDSTTSPGTSAVRSVVVG